LKGGATIRDRGNAHVSNEARHARRVPANLPLEIRPRARENRNEAAQFVSLVLVMLVTGVFWGSWLGLSRSMQTFTPDTYLAIGHAMIANLAPVMPALVILAALSQLVLLFELRSSGLTAILPTLIAFMLFLIAVAITLLVEVPIDNQIRTWTPTSLPADWMLIRDRWETFHVVRTFSAVGAVIVLTARYSGCRGKRPNERVQCAGLAGVRSSAARRNPLTRHDDAATRTITNALENSAGTGKMKRQAITPLASVASTNAAIIGRTRAGSARAREAICHKMVVCSSMATLIDHPKPMKKSKYDRFAPMVSKRTAVIAFSTSFSPIGDHFRKPPRV
jgi:Domain of unknown function (DUF1772)